MPRRGSNRRLPRWLTRRRLMFAAGSAGVLAGSAVVGQVYTQASRDASGGTATPTRAGPALGATGIDVGTPVSVGYGHAADRTWRADAPPAESGTVAWEVEFGEAGGAVAAPLAGADQLFVTSLGRQGALHRVDVATGTSRGRPLGLTDATGSFVRRQGDPPQELAGPTRVTLGAALAGDRVVVPVEPAASDVGAGYHVVDLGGDTNQRAGITTQILGGRGRPAPTPTARPWVSGDGERTVVSSYDGGLVGVESERLVSGERERTVASLVDGATWRRAGSPERAPGTVASDGERLVFVDPDTEALTLTDQEGMARWTNERYAGELLQTGVSLTGDTVYARGRPSGPSAGVHAFDLADGSHRWNRDVTATGMAVAPAADRVVVAGGRRVRALTSRGRLVWSQSLLDETPSTPPRARTETPTPRPSATPTPTTEQTVETPPPTEGTARATLPDGAPLSPALHEATHSTRWVGQPTVAGDGVYVAVRRGDETRVSRFELAGGDRTWRSDALPPTQVPYVVLTGGLAVVTASRLPWVAPARSAASLRDRPPRLVAVGTVTV